MGFPVGLNGSRSGGLVLLVKRVMCSNGGAPPNPFPRERENMRVRWWRLGGSGGRRMIFILLSQGEGRGEGEDSFPEFYSR